MGERVGGIVHADVLVLMSSTVKVVGLICLRVSVRVDDG